MRIVAIGGGVVLIVAIVWDAFEALVLPRRVTRRLRPTRLFYRATWRVWRDVATRMRSGSRRETYLSFYGPLSLLILISLWAASLVLGFALIQWGLGPRLNVPYGPPGFGASVYLSGTTFFTLGLGDVTPTSPLARSLVVVESGMGFGFLAIVIGYLPVLYQAFSRREVNISLLDARAGSPPTAGELMHRLGGDVDEMRLLLREWERWSGELMESHLSYPVLAYFRSQHDNESWLAAMTAMLDITALIVAGVRDGPTHQAQLTFAIARHAVVDLAQVFGTRPRRDAPDRLPFENLVRLAELVNDQVPLDVRADPAERLRQLRAMYEPYVGALADHFLVTLPPWHPAVAATDNWRTSAWERSLGGRPAESIRDVHDDDFE